MIDCANTSNGAGEVQISIPKAVGPVIRFLIIRDFVGGEKGVSVWVYWQKDLHVNISLIIYCMYNGD